MLSYHGQFEQGVANGIATIEFSQRRQGENTGEGGNQKVRYEGMVKAGKLHGIGKLTKRDGTVIEGIWHENELREQK